MNNRQDEDHKPSTGVVEEQAIPVVEERVTTQRRIAEGGRTVTVTTRPVTETVNIAEPVTRENVSVERVPVGEVVSEVPPVREQGDLTVIPVVEERVTVSVELVLREEIHLRRTRETVTEEHQVDVRRTQVEIDDPAIVQKQST